MALRDVIARIFNLDPVYQSQWSWGADFRSRILGMEVEELWRTQPYLRLIVTFLARNIAQLGLPLFERVEETDRRRVR